MNSIYYLIGVMFYRLDNEDTIIFNINLKQDINNSIEFIRWIIGIWIVRVLWVGEVIF